MSIALDPAPFKAFFDRNTENVHGLFSIVDTKTGKKIFDRLPVRSGQAGYTHTSWVSGKSPIPFSNQLSSPLRILLKRPNQEGQWAGQRGIGEFWLIINVPGTELIRGKNSGEVRQAIGCHPENMFVGSAGCIVFVCDTLTQKKELLRLSRWAKALIGKYAYIPLEVL